MRRSFVRRLPRSVRWLWFAILALIGLELGLAALGLALGGTWLAVALQLMSVTAAPLALGLVVVVLAGAWAGRHGPAPKEEPAPEAARPPRTDAPPEASAIQRTGQAVVAAARTPEGRAAIRYGARLVRAGRAAMRPPPEPPAEPERDR